MGEKLLSEWEKSSAQESGGESSPPIACCLGVFDDQQRQRHRELLAMLDTQVQEVTEVPDGFILRFSSDPAVCQVVLEFVTLERLCCPFFTFRLELPPQQGPLLFSLTGPPEAKEILRAFVLRTSDPQGAAG